MNFGIDPYLVEGQILPIVVIIKPEGDEVGIKILFQETFITNVTQYKQSVTGS